MKSWMKGLLEVIENLLPFLFRNRAKEAKGFADLLKGQFDYLWDKVEEFQADYIECMMQIRQLTKEVNHLSNQLSKVTRSE